MFRKILVGVDGSTSSLKAVALAAQLSEAHRAELVLVHVVQLSAIADQVLKISATEHLKENPKSIMEKLSQDILDQARKRALQAGALEEQITAVTTDRATIAGIRPRCLSGWRMRQGVPETSAPGL